MIGSSSATPGGPLLTFDVVPPCPPAPRKSKPPPGHFDLTEDAPVRRLDFGSSSSSRDPSPERAPVAQQHPQQQHPQQQQQQQQQWHQAAAQPRLHLPDAAQQQLQQQQQSRGASAPAGETLPFGGADQQHHAGGPVLGAHQRPQHQRPHPYINPQQSASVAAMDLVSPTAAGGPFASPASVKPKRAPSTPVRLFR
jgi:hypothetical protein